MADLGFENQRCIYILHFHVCHICAWRNIRYGLYNLWVLLRRHTSSRGQWSHPLPEQEVLLSMVHDQSGLLLFGNHWLGSPQTLLTLGWFVPFPNIRTIILWWDVGPVLAWDHLSEVYLYSFSASLILQSEWLGRWGRFWGRLLLGLLLLLLSGHIHHMLIVTSFHHHFKVR